MSSTSSSSSTASSSPPVVRLRSPGELAAAVPQLCGFVPHESLVVLSLRGARSRLGLTLRIDLPPPQDAAAAAACVAGRLRADRARAAAVVVWSDDPDRGAQAVLVEALAASLRRSGVDVVEQVLVAQGRWWSYACASAGCCPPHGTPLPGPATPALALVAAHSAFTGRAVLPSRAALVAQLAPSGDPSDGELLRVARARRRERVRAEGRGAVARDALLLWRRTLRAAPVRAPGATSAGVAAELVVALEDVVVRDEVLGWALEEAEALLALLLHLASRSAPPHDVELCAVLGWVAHLRGDGALAGVALDRALATRPGHGLAALGRQALDAQVAPQAVRALLADARAALRRQHPETGCWAGAEQ